LGSWVDRQKGVRGKKNIVVQQVEESSNTEGLEKYSEDKFSKKEVEGL